MNKNRIRLTESQLHKVIKESVKKVLREGVNYTDDVDADDVYNQLFGVTIRIAQDLFGTYNDNIDNICTYAADEGYKAIVSYLKSNYDNM